MPRKIRKCDHDPKFLVRRYVKIRGYATSFMQCSECHNELCRRARAKKSVMQKAFRELATKPWLIEDKQ
jgi:hypothetical protein